MDDRAVLAAASERGGEAFFARYQRYAESTPALTPWPAEEAERFRAAPT